MRRLSARVELIGDSYDETFAHAMKTCKKNKSVFVPPFDDAAIIAGQGTIGREILNQHPGELDAIFLPVGGGGLIAGVANFVKQVRPRVKIIGVEPADANAMQQSLRAGRAVKLKQVGIFADGVAVKCPGKLTLQICKKFVDDMITVSTDEMCAAIKDICEDTRTLVEPSGALSVAGVKKYCKKKSQQRDKNFAAVCTGANMNFDRLRHVSERAEIGERREAILR